MQQIEIYPGNKDTDYLLRSFLSDICDPQDDITASH